MRPGAGALRLASAGTLIIALVAACAAVPTHPAQSAPMISTTSTSSSTSTSTTVASTTAIPTTTAAPLVIVLTNPADIEVALQQAAGPLLGRRLPQSDLDAFTSYFHGLETAAQQTTSGIRYTVDLAAQADQWIRSRYATEVAGRNMASAMRAVDCFISPSRCASTTTTNWLGQP